MKYFSVDFIPESKDLNKKAIFLNLIFGSEKNKLFATLLMLCAFTVFAFFVGQYELIFYSLIALVVIPRVAEAVLVLSQIRIGDTELSKRPVTVDFYGEHIVYRYNSTQKFKGSFEKHYALNKVTNVIESKNAFTFAFGEKDTVLIPKRALNEQTHQMIENLIENFFRNKFIKVDF